MLKKSAYRRILLSTLALLVLIFVYLFPTKNEGINETINYIDALKMPVYLKDKNNYVSRINVLKESNDINDIIKSIINTLTIGTSEEEYLPTGFSGLIPENTKLNTFDINNKLLKLDFSKEFLNTTKENELKMIEALIFSMCELEEIDEIMIFIEGEKLNFLEKNKITLPNTLNKNFGINKTYDITSIKDIKNTINYYVSKTDDLTYYVPISIAKNTDYEKIEIIISNLQTSPINQTNLISYLKASATLDDYTILEESILLSFDNELIADLSDDNIIEEVKYSIFLSLRDTYDVKSVIFEDKNEQIVSVLLD